MCTNNIKTYFKLRSSFEHKTKKRIYIYIYSFFSEMHNSKNRRSTAHRRKLLHTADPKIIITVHPFVVCK